MTAILKLNTPSGGSVSLRPQDTSVYVVLTLPNTTGTLVSTTDLGDSVGTVVDILETALDTKQSTLVSGTNLKTVGTISLLGSGDITSPTFEDVAISGTGGRITGDFYATTPANRVLFQSSVSDKATVVGAMPSGAGTISGWRGYGSSDPANSSYCDFTVNGSSLTAFTSGNTGAGAYAPMGFYVGGAQRLLIGTDGAVTVNGNALSGTNTGDQDLSGKQDVLVSGTNIKTVDGISLLGSGNISTGLIPINVTGTTQTAVSGNLYTLTNVAATTLTLPVSPALGDTVAICPDNGLTTNVIARNGQTIMKLAEDMTLNNALTTVTLRFLNNSWRLV